jgi:hypothetical protein
MEPILSLSSISYATSKKQPTHTHKLVVDVFSALANIISMMLRKYFVTDFPGSRYFNNDDD